MYSLKPTLFTAIHATFLMTGLFAATSQAVEAQATAQTVCGSVQPARPIRRFTGAQNYMYQTLELKAPVSIANLPDGKSRGAAYTGGVYYPRLKCGQCYVMRYLSKDSATEVMRFYRDQLMQNGWQINDTQTNTKQLTALRKNDGHYLTLCVYPSSKSGYRSSFDLKYLSAGAVQTQAL